MRKTLATLVLSCFLSISFADINVNVVKYFNGEAGCFILYDLMTAKRLTEYNPNHCKLRVSPNATFDVALSLMAFDQNVINEGSLFTWDGKQWSTPSWNQNQNPETWLTSSVAWVSQTLTPLLGMNKINSYLKIFDYGNQDFSGDKGKNNGLTNAWLESSLQISAEEQMNFLNKLIDNNLPVSKAAMSYTKENMYLETSPKGWMLYGKTASGKDPNLAWPEGWFMGFVENGNKAYGFVLNFVDTQPPETDEDPGLLAKDKVKGILTELGYY
jgi:beta-lactamase class D